MSRPNRENDKLLQVRMPEEMHKRLMGLHVDGGVSLLVRDLLRKEIDRLEQKKRTKALRVSTR